MNNSLKDKIKLLIPRFILKQLKEHSNKKVIAAWRKSGSPVPPPHQVKQNTISQYAKHYGYNTLIETGTYTGRMVEAQKDHFDRIISIELDDQLYKNAARKFEPYNHINILHGDSGKVMSELLRSVDEPTIFWLDGHYSGGITAKGEKKCPIFDEINHILSSRITKCILLIDDARHFIGINDYPTIDELRAYIEKSIDNFSFEVKDDIIRIVI